jgi:hypothetical protein
MKVTKLSTLYHLKNKEYDIFASKTDSGITLTTYDEHDKFEFKNSDPELIKEIGKLLIKASEL